MEELRNRRGERIDARFHPGTPGRPELIVLGHGVTGNLDRPFARRIAELAAERGLAALRISFSGNGESEGRFEDASISKEVADLESVLAAFPERRIAYVGHSMGAAVGVLVAARDERVRLLVSIAGMVHTRDFCERKFGALTPGRDVMWERPECPLSATFVEDLAAIDSVLESAAGIHVPWLLVHGTRDDVVPLRDSEDALAAAGTNAELHRVEGADHVFSEPALDPMAALVVAWLEQRFAALAG